MTANAEQGLRPERVAEIIVRLPGEGDRPGGGRRGSGYLVAPGRVLTAAHVVEGAVDVEVRYEADRPGERTVEAAVVWADPGIDVAVLAVPEDDVASVAYGGLGEQDTVVRCTAVGFPRFKLRTDTDGSRFRDAEHVHATCAVLSNRREGTLDLGVSPAPAEDPDPARDAWEGMSGAAVFSGGLLVGVVSRHHRAEGTGRIAASRVDRWAEVLDDTRQADLERLLGHRLGSSALPSATRPAHVGRVQEFYRAQLADSSAPESLSEREQELADLVSFCGGTERYLWLQGPPWAGKTALAAWFALHPPCGVVPVWFFVTARDAGQSDGDACTAALIDQLAAVVGREPTPTTSPTARDGERRLLLREAAEQVARDGGTLLLVVDGLDEDQSLTPGRTGPSIASLLPERPPPGLRVLVTSRTAPALPDDVKGGHPLRTCRVVTLSATAAARHTEHEAKFDLRQALSGERLPRDLVGFLTVARGPLNLDDLYRLTGEPPYDELRRRLDSAFGRIVRLRGDAHGGGGGPDGHGDDLLLYAPTHGYLFAHDTLRTAAQQELGPDLGGYLERLHAWADRYAERGWPEDTPPYLLRPYGRLLTLLGDTRRATSLATDPRRRDRLHEATGSDAACLAELAAVRETVLRTTPDDLGTLAALAAAQDMVARRNDQLHPDVPRAYALLGRVRQAVGLARSLPHPLLRAPALTGVARALAAAGDRRALEVAKEALRTAEAIPSDVRFFDDPPCALAARGTLIAVLAAAGDGEEAGRLLDGWTHSLREQDRPEDDEMAAALIEAFTTTFAAVPEPVGASELVRRVEHFAERIRAPRIRLATRALLAEAWATGTDVDHGARLYASLAPLARQHTDAYADELALAAEALHRVRPAAAENGSRAAQARTVLARAVLARESVSTLRRENGGASLSDTVLALVAEGRVDEAERLTESAPGEAEHYQLADMWLAIADGRAREGRAAQAWAALEQGWYHRTPEVHERSGARVAVLLAEAGADSELEALLLGGTVAWHGGVFEALTALAGELAATDPARALRILRRAEGRSATAGPMPEYLSVALAALATALAAVGLFDEAERLVEGIDEPKAHAWGYSAVAVAVAPDEPDRAVRLAERALDEAATIEDDRNVRPNTRVNAAQALARAGAVDAAVAVVEQGSQDDVTHWRDGYHRRVTWAEVAAGLWFHDREVAGRVFDNLFDLVTSLRPPRVRDIAYLLATVAAHDGERGAWAWTALPLRNDPTSGNDVDEDALLALVTAATDPAEARHRMDALLAECAREIPGFRPGDVEILVYAALGELEAARAMARGKETEEERAVALMVIAEYVAQALLHRLATPIFAGERSSLLTARRLAPLLLPKRSGPDPALARDLLAEALTPDGWYHAIQVLAVLDPDTVLRVRDTVFAQLGLDDRAVAGA